MEFDITAMEQAVREHNDTIRQMNEEFRKKSEHFIKEGFEQFLLKYPFVKELYWVQFNPSFNDGEACEFSVYDLCIIPADEEHNENSEYDQEITLTGFASDFSESKLKTQKSLLEEYVKWEENKAAYAADKIVMNDWAVKEKIRADGLRPDSIDQATRNIYYDKLYKERIQGYKPHWRFESSDDVRKDIASIEKNREEHPGFGEDAEKIVKIFSSIPDNIMESIYGDGYLVIVSNYDGKVILQKQEYDHY